MTVSALTLLLAGVLCGCAVVLTGAILLFLREARGTLRKLESLLPPCKETLEEVTDTFRQARQILTRTNRATQAAEEVIDRTRRIAFGVVDQLARITERAQHVCEKRLGNGAGPKPRQTGSRG